MCINKSVSKATSFYDVMSRYNLFDIQKVPTNVNALGISLIFVTNSWITQHYDGLCVIFM